MVGEDGDAGGVPLSQEEAHEITSEMGSTWRKSEEQLSVKSCTSKCFETLNIEAEDTQEFTPHKSKHSE